MNEEIKERFKKMLKTAIDAQACKEPLEVGFRRGVEWYVFESGFTGINIFIEENLLLKQEVEQLKSALHRTVQP